MISDSAGAAALLQRLEGLGVRLRLDGENLKLDAPRGAVSTELRAELRLRKAALIDALKKTGGDAGSGPRPGPPADEYPLSFAQRRLWFIDSMSDGNAAYNLFKPLRLRGPFRPAWFVEAYNKIIARHQSLRMNFVNVDGMPRAIVTENARLSAEVLDLSELGPDEQAARLGAEIKREKDYVFDLRRDLPVRLRFLKFGADDHVMLVNTHHIVSDGWSIGIWRREAARYYRALAENQALDDAPLPLQYGDFARWQNERMEGGFFDAQLEYWKNALSELPELRLPLDRPRPARRTFDGDVSHFEIPNELRDLIVAASREGRATTFMTLMATWQIVLSRFSGQDDFGVATPIANRNLAETRDLIGFFVNTLILRADLSGDPNFRAILRRVRERAMEAYENQDCPFEKIVEVVGVERALNRSPLAQVLFTMEREVAEDLDLPGVRTEFIRYPDQTVRFDLELHVIEKDGASLEGFLIWNRDLFDAESAKTILDAWLFVTRAALVQQDTPVSILPLQSDPAARKMIALAGESPAVPRELSIPELFLRRVEQRPESVALSLRESTLSYGELNRRADDLALELSRRGVGRGASVALLMERSFELIVSMLGVLKAGAAFIPMAPGDPADRLAHIITETGTKVLLYHGATAEAAEQIRAATRTSPELVDAANISETSPRPVSGRPGPGPGPGARDAACIMYTSGSTGKPRGAIFEHRGLIRLVHNTRFLWFSEDRSILLNSSVAFDVSHFEIWGALLNGGRLVIQPPGYASAEDICAEVRLRGVDTLWLTAALFHHAAEHHLDDLVGLRFFLAGGDVLSPRHVAMVRERLPGTMFINAYGPTENTTFTTSHLVTDVDERAVPIGRAITGTRAYVLDGALRPVPPGVVGELCAGGEGVVRGYVARPGMTADRFVPDPYGERPGDRMYRTGDYARMDRSGVVHFLGRRDGQFKLRGFRVEPGEIENTLASAPGVAGAAVRLVNEGDDKEIIAYIEPRAAERAGFEPAEEGEYIRPANDSFESDLRRYLGGRLPAYMVPARFAYLDRLPVNRNGKLNRAALPAPPARGRRHAPATGPLSDRERRVSRIWEELLKRDDVGPDDNFFELGGHSMMVMRLLARLKKDFNAGIGVASIFENPTVRLMARLLDPGTESEGGVDQSERGPATVPATSHATPAPSAARHRRHSSRILIPLQPEGEGAPFFCVHPAGGSPLCYLGLARGMGKARPFYGIQDRALENPDETPVGDIPEMARIYIEEIQKVQPAGPYYLGGWSVGGLIAYEMAQQLRERGMETGYLALFEVAPYSFYMNISPAEFYNNMLGGMRMQVDNAGSWTTVDGITANMRYAGVPVPEIDRAEFVDEPSAVAELWRKLAPEMERFRLVDDAAQTAYRNYVPRPYEGRADHYRVEWNHFGAMGPYFGLFTDPMIERWRALQPRGFQVHTVTGNHYNMFDPANTELLARTLSAALERARRES